MDRWSNKVAVVTGASAGIGAAITEQLVHNGLKVVGLARRKEKLEELEKKIENFYPVQCDVSNEQDVLKAFAWIKDNVGPVHILVNNAGILRETSLIDGNSGLWRKVFDTNVFGLCVATKEAIKDMKANNVDGHVVHINSLAGHRVKTKEFNVYAASKHAVTALTETLRQELNSIGSKIKVTSISPGFVETDIFTTSAVSSGSKEISEKIQEMLNKAPKLLPKDVADAVIYVLSTPPHVQVHELMIQPVGAT